MDPSILRSRLGVTERRCSGHEVSREHLTSGQPAADTPVTPDGGPPTPVIWPPVRKVCLPAKVRVTESFAARRRPRNS